MRNEIDAIIDAEAAKRFGTDLARHFDRMLLASFGVPEEMLEPSSSAGGAVTAAAQPLPGAQLTLEALDQIVRELSRPHPVALWFVDRNSLYYQVRELLACDAAVRTVPCESIYGLRLVQWESCIATEEERARTPWFCRVPGVWVEISDGNYCRLEDREAEEGSNDAEG